VSASDRTKYSFGDSDIARERLAIVADTFEAPTRRLLADLPPMQPRYVVDMGCGPGHVAGYLSRQSVRMVGIDLSPEMIRVASELQPGIEFRAGDMRALDLPDGSLAGVIAFYAIVHFQPEELGPVFREMRRVLAPGGLALLSFHVGEEVVHLDDLFGAPVSLDFRFHVPDRVIEALESAGFTVMERIDRQPYEGAEYPSRRCYLLARATE